MTAKKSTAKKKAASKKKDQHPLVGHKFTDFNNRTLLVTEVDLGDPNGREVKGEVTYLPNGKEHSERTDPYSVTLKIFDHIWVKKAPPADPVEMATRAHKRGGA